MDRVAVIIPALNEAGTIRAVVAEILEVLGSEMPALPLEVIVIDNGSTDATAREASLAGAKVVFESRQGYGNACAAGIDASTEAEILAFIDGDYSFLPTELPSILKPVLENRADLVLGSRVLGRIEEGAMPPHQRFGNWLAARLMSALYGIELTDLGPFRAIRRQLLNGLHMQEKTYGWPTEMIVKSARRQARILEVPVSYHHRRAGQSKVSGTLRGSLLAAWFILGVTLRYAFSSQD